MTNKQIYIVSAPKHSGKTTKLTRWSANRNDVFGILTPMENGNRIFMDAHTKEPFHMEATADETDILEVGKYRFSKASFDKASGILLAALKQVKGYIIVDEIGPLELRGFGFSATVKAMLEDKKNKMQIVLVVREELLEKVVDYFNLKRFDIVPMTF
jgi:nucleoside-triphosphatase THEP1